METKKCPYCGEEIMAAAKKCKHCGEWLNEEPAQTPGSPEKPSEEKTMPKETGKPKQQGTPKEISALNVASGYFYTYLLQPIKSHYADFKGKASRKEYWLYVLFYGLFLMCVSAAAFAMGAGIGMSVYTILCLLLLIPTLAITVRRLHDVGKSGWWIFISMVPLIGVIWLLILLCKKGSDAPRSKWGAMDYICSGVLALLFLCGTLLGGGSTEYYVLDEEEWEVDSEFSCFFTIATTDEADVIAIREGFVEEYTGELTIVKTENPDDGELEPVLSAGQIAGKDKEHAVPTYFTLFPSSKHADILYFNYRSDGMEFGRSGKVDVSTGKFELFDGEIIGKIETGRFKGCYLRIDENGTRIYSQAKIGEKETAPQDADAYNEVLKNYTYQHANAESNEELLISLGREFE